MRIKISLKDVNSNVLLERTQNDIVTLAFKKRYQLVDY